MEDAEVQSRGAGRVRKKSQKLLEMEDFASAWKQQQQHQQQNSAKMTSPRKKSSSGNHKTLSVGSEGGKHINCGSVGGGGANGAEQLKRDKSVPKARDEDCDWKSNDGNIDGTPANPKIIPQPASRTGSISKDEASDVPKSIVVTKPLVVTKPDASSRPETLVVKNTSTLSSDRVETGSKRPADRVVVIGGVSEETPKKKPKSTTSASTTPFHSGNGGAPKSIMKTKESGSSSIRTPSTPGLSTSHVTQRQPPPTPPLIATTKKMQINFEEELLKADLALRKQKPVKKVKPNSTNKETVASASASSSSPSQSKSESMPTIVPSSSAFAALEASLKSGDDRSRGGGGGGGDCGGGSGGGSGESDSSKSVSFKEGKKGGKVEKSPKKEKRKREKKHDDREARERKHEKLQDSNNEIASERLLGNDTREKPKDGLGSGDADKQGYVLFCKTARREVRKDFPSISFADITQVAVERWNALSAKDKMNWSRKAAKHALAVKAGNAGSGMSKSLVSASSAKNSVSIKKTFNVTKPISPSKRVNTEKSAKQQKPPQRQQIDSAKEEQQQQRQRQQQPQHAQPHQRRDQRQSHLELKPDLGSHQPVTSSIKPSIPSPISSPNPSTSHPVARPVLPSPPPAPPPDPSQFVPPPDVDYSSIPSPSPASTATCSTSAPCPSTSLDSAANLKLLGESLTVIGTRLTATTTPLAVQGGLSVLMDSLLCATAPLTALLTSEIPELKDDEETRNLQAQIMENAAYLMPGM